MDDAPQSKRDAAFAAARADYARLRGTVVMLAAVEAYRVGTDDVRTVALTPPVAFKISVTMSDDMITRTNDPWIDPIYDVDPVDPSDPQVVNYRSFWCYGISYNYESGEQQPGDFAS
jgi:hypothetical protein